MLQHEVGICPWDPDDLSVHLSTTPIDTAYSNSLKYAGEFKTKPNHMVIISMVTFYCESVSSGQCNVVLWYSRCDTYWNIRNLVLMQEYTWCAGNTGHSALISGHFCVFKMFRYTRVCDAVQTRSLPSLNPDWQHHENARESSWWDQKSLQWLLCHQHFLQSCTSDWSEKGLPLITLSVLECCQLSQVLEPKRIYQVWTLHTLLQHQIICGWIWKQTKTQIIICVYGKCTEQ